MKLSEHPVWLVGFRPFFILACLSGVILPLVWALIFNAKLSVPTMSAPLIQWHAHEMFFGFGWAVLGGFLLTSTKNWVKIRGFHGNSLIFLTCAWLFERAGMSFGANWPVFLFLISNNIFLVSLTSMIVWTLVRHRSSDSYQDNLFFIIIVPLFLISKNLILSTEYFKLGTSMTIGIFRMAFLLMLERTLTQFMKSVFQVEILRNSFLDYAIKGLGFLLIFESLLPSTMLAQGLMFGLAFLLAIRFVFWKPFVAMKRIEIAVMYLGYLGIILNLLLLSPFIVEMQLQVFNISLVGTVAVHFFTVGTMGLVIPAMIIRICNGHTGRKINFDFYNKFILWIMILGFIFRIIGPQLIPARYTLWIFITALCWGVSFSLIAWRYVPYLLKSRIDGKEH